MPENGDILAVAQRFCDPAYVRSLQAYRTWPVVRAGMVLWLQIVIAWGLALLLPWPMAVASFIIVCACQQGMLLWVHEASHWTLFRDRKLNDLWADLIMATPLGITVQSYRTKHHSHHVHLGAAADQDRWAYTKDIRGWRALKVIFGTLGGYHGVVTAVIYLMGHRQPPEGKGRSGNPQRQMFWTYRMSRLCMTCGWNALFLGLCIFAGRWYFYLLLWVFPLLTISILLNIVRSTAEHQPNGFTSADLTKPRLEPSVRTTLPNPVEKWFLYQANFNYHLEHHLYPAVPFFNLPILHKHLSDRGFYERYPQCRQWSGVRRFFELSLDPAARALSPTTV